MLEIERKFLVHGEPWREAGPGTAIVQGYLARGEQTVVRVRLATDRAWLTVKGRSEGISRSEFEYGIPAADARALLRLCSGGLIEKTRYTTRVGGRLFEIDVFGGANEGLVLAEIELEREDQPFERPLWLGEEVSLDHRYANSNLAEQPFSRWRR